MSSKMRGIGVLQVRRPSGRAYVRSCRRCGAGAPATRRWGVAGDSPAWRFGTPNLCRYDLHPSIRTSVSMISDEGKGKRHVEEQAQRGGDDRRPEAEGAGQQNQELAVSYDPMCGEWGQVS